MKTKKYITHGLLGFNEKLTVLHIINYGDVVDDNKLKFTTAMDGEMVVTIEGIKKAGYTDVIGFDEIDFPGSLWKWEKQRNPPKLPYVMDETINDGELVVDKFWPCFDIMVKITDTEILYKPILIPIS